MDNISSHTNNKIKFRIQDFVSVEFAFVFYFWSFIFLKPFFGIDGQNSFYILLSSALFSLLIFLFSIVKNKIRLNTGVFIYPIITIFFFLLDSTFRSNSEQSGMFYIFVYQCFIPIVLLSGITNIRSFFLLYSWFSLLLIPLFSLDQLQLVPLLGDYMAYGFNFAFPAFLGVYLGFRYFKKWYFFPFSLVIFIFIVLFANRGAILASFSFILALELLLSRNKYKFYSKLLIYLGLLVVTTPILIEVFITLSNNIGYESRSLRILSDVIWSEQETFNRRNLLSDDFFSGREFIWNEAITMIDESPLLGSGIGAFEFKNGLYTHNFFLDLLCNGGAFLFIFVMAWLLMTIRKFFVKKTYATEIKLFALFFILQAFPKLFLSQEYVIDLSFTVFMSLLFLKVNNIKV